MTEAYAIKDANGDIRPMHVRKWQRECWKSLTGVDEEVELQARIEQLKLAGFSCVPVTVSEKGEADKDSLRYAELKRMLPELMATCAQAGNNTPEAMDVLFGADTSKLDEFIDAYLSRRQG